MAILQCPECGDPVSDGAVKCPHCGKRLVEETPEGKIRQLGKKYRTDNPLTKSGGYLVVAAAGLLVYRAFSTHTEWAEFLVLTVGAALAGLGLLLWLFGRYMSR